jgi:type IV secretory pathway protease TraF
MPAIGYVTRDGNGFKGELKTLSIRADIAIVPNGHKSADTQPDYRVSAGGVEVGAGWIRRGEHVRQGLCLAEPGRPRIRPPAPLRQSRPRPPARTMTTPSPSSGTRPTESSDRSAPRPGADRLPASTGSKTRMLLFSTLPGPGRAASNWVLRTARSGTAARRTSHERHCSTARSKARETCPFLTAKQAAFHLGIALGHAQGHAARRDAARPAASTASAWYYHIDDIDAWSDARKKGGDRWLSGAICRLFAWGAALARRAPPAAPARAPAPRALAPRLRLLSPPPSSLPPRPRLVWNASASAPVGLYGSSRQALPLRAPRHGGRAKIPPGSSREIAARRHYSPANVPLVKQRRRRSPATASAPPGHRITINGHPVAVAPRQADTPRAARCPGGRGCRTLGDGTRMLLLMAGSPDSFDGRYFGPSLRAPT